MLHLITCHRRIMPRLAELLLKLISCQIYNSNTLRNIMMVFGRNVEQDEMMCRIKE